MQESVRDVFRTSYISGQTFTKESKDAGSKLTYILKKLYASELFIGLWLFGSSSGWARDWILKNCRTSIGPYAGAKLNISVSDTVFAIAGIKQKEHVV